MRVKIILIFSLIVITNSISYAQNTIVTVSGIVKDQAAKTALSFVNVVLRTEKDSAFITGSVTNEEGRFSLSNIKPGNYFLEVLFIGYITKRQSLYVGSLTEFLDVTTIELAENGILLLPTLIRSQISEDLFSKALP